MIRKNKMEKIIAKRHIRSLFISLLLVSMIAVFGVGKVYAQGSVSSKSLQMDQITIPIGSDFYNHFISTTTVDLTKNKVVYNKQSSVAKLKKVNHHF